MDDAAIDAKEKELLDALKDKNSDLREQAADSLVRLGKAGKSVIDALFLALKDKSYDVRLQAAESLGRLGKADKSQE